VKVGPRLVESPLDVVWFSGNDALSFLNDLISQQISDLDEGEIVRSLLLSPQGKIDHLLWVVQDGQRVGLIAETGRGDELAVTLSRYRIRVDVEIELSEGAAWLVVGPGDGFDVSWPEVERHLTIGEKPVLPVVPTEEYQRLRLEAAEPVFGVDIDEGTIPQEVPALVAAAVDFTKGCYLGQELVARINSRGSNVPRTLRKLRIEGDSPRAGEAIVEGEKTVGSITSVARDLALGLVHRSVDAGSVVYVGGKKATVLNS
jgi:folate-binding protein YgfZ